MKKIGIITFHNAHNYGAFLQVYALGKKIKKMGYDCFVINFRNKYIMNSYKLIKISKNPIKCIKLIYKSFKDYKINKLRYDKFNYVINNKLDLTDRYNSLKILKKKYPKFDCYITGSDQVWNSNITNGLQDSYTLNFGDKKIKRISYAASIGNSKIDSNEESDYKQKIGRIDSISVREESAKRILQPLVNKDIDVVLDPTLLIDNIEWNEILEKEEVENERQKYIFAYVVEKNDEYVKILNELSSVTNLKVIHCANENNGIENVLRSAYTDNPFEFVNLIKNAEYVVCTSFHATVFSIIFNKKFWVVPHKKTGSRVTDLLEKLKITDRVVYSLEEFKKVNFEKKINYEEVNKILIEERKKSLNWLNNAIDN